MGIKPNPKWEAETRSIIEQMAKEKKELQEEILANQKRDLELEEEIRGLKAALRRIGVEVINENRDRNIRGVL